MKTRKKNLFQTNEKPYECLPCNKQYAERTSLKAHERTPQHMFIA